MRNAPSEVVSAPAATVESDFFRIVIEARASGVLSAVSITMPRTPPAAAVGAASCAAAYPELVTRSSAATAIAGLIEVFRRRWVAAADLSASADPVNEMDRY